MMVNRKFVHTIAWVSLDLVCELDASAGARSGEMPDIAAGLRELAVRLSCGVELGGGWEARRKRRGARDVKGPALVVSKPGQCGAEFAWESMPAALTSMIFAAPGSQRQRRRPPVHHRIRRGRVEFYLS